MLLSVSYGTGLTIGRNLIPQDGELRSPVSALKQFTIIKQWEPREKIPGLGNPLGAQRKKSKCLFSGREVSGKIS